MKLRKPRITEEQAARAATDYNAGLPIDEILKRNNMSRMTLYRVLRKIS